jgi:hypothetical protein
MKIKIIIVFILFMSVWSGKAQNLILNPSFENIVPVFPFPVTPYFMSMLTAANDWWSLAKVGGTCDGSNLVYSTPDLFKVTPGAVHLQGINGHTGTAYAGMARAEIIQQKLSQPLETGRYRLKLFIRGRGNSLGIVNAHQPTGCSLTLGAEVSAVKVFINNEKIEYDDSVEDPVVVGNFFSDMKKNNLQPIAFINAPIEANNTWTEISTEFFIDNTNSQWIGFEGTFSEGYTFLDDISLEKIPCASCTASCNPESGCIDAAIAVQPCNVEIVKLGNVSSLDFKVTGANGVEYRNVHIDHPTCRVRFDGRNEQGVDIGSGIFVMTAKIKNGCDIKILTKTFFKSFDWSGPDCQLDPIDYSSLSALSKFNPKLLCCPQNIAIGSSTQITDITLPPTGIITCVGIGEYFNRQSINNLPSLNIKAKNEISIQGGIDNVKDVTFTAPKIIISGSTTSPMVIYPGATFINGINCPAGLKADDDNVSATSLQSNFDKNDLFSEKTASLENLDDNRFKFENIVGNDKNSFFRISPNPTDGNFNLAIPTNIDLSELRIDVYNYLGKKVIDGLKLNSYSQIVNISQSISGVYVVQARKNGLPIWISKVIKVD